MAQINEFPPPAESVPRYEAYANPGIPAGIGIAVIYEHEGRTTAAGTLPIQPMSDTQARHLLMSLAQHLGIDSFVTLNHGQMWSDLRGALNTHREREGVEVEVNSRHGWMDLRDYLPEQYRN
ncbi:hypothetical protein QC999_gp49 [Microbacterium phage Cressida]|uniref:Uncharacterized protein n=1 Tax=Microbacterium phage Cressida TaxID=2591216 RepID=A0A514DI61_9CAUD|nr:hypothetical protein QC999_gp49 [Microbacterium phage Cressida]QDH93301.1 hypothetical protein PBI_CRESSIDA_59 [Microbacterium phage Cressida]